MAEAGGRGPAAKPGPGVLLFHQSNRDRKSWDAVARQLTAAGINVLTLDSRGHGESAGNTEAAEKWWREDLEPAFNYLASQPGVNRDVIPYAMAFGDHAELAGLNLIGLKRRGLTREAINALRAAFRSIFYGEGGDIKSRAMAAKAQWPDAAEVNEVVQFILAPAKQKLCTARRRGGIE